MERMPRGDMTNSESRMSKEFPMSNDRTTNGVAVGSRWIPLVCVRHFLVAIFFCLACSTAHARINVVSLPDRDTVQLTIYNSVDLTLVKETRHLTFKKGLNKLEFSWANTLIDPTSVEFKAFTHAD